LLSTSADLADFSPWNPTFITFGGRSQLEVLRVKEKASHKVERLVDLVSYQVGSVVSRTIVDKDAGTVTLFAFDAGEGLSEHTAPYDAMVTVLEGEAEVKIAGEPFLLGEGDMIVMPAEVPHALRAVDRFKMLLVMVKA
jgi:quercetin dioxygenase-like cupin family protein